MSSSRPIPKPPQTFRDFAARYPELAKAWEAVQAAEASAGPLDERTRRLIKLGIAIGARQEGSVHSSVRKGLAQGIPRDELEQVVALAAGTLGFPATVAAFAWVREEIAKQNG